MKSINQSINRNLALLNFLIITSCGFTVNLGAQNLFEISSKTPQSMPEKSQAWFNQYESNRSVKKVSFINLQNIDKIQKNRQFNIRIPDEKEVFTAVGKHIKYRDEYNYYWSGSINNQEKKYQGEIQITWKIAA